MAVPKRRTSKARKRKRRTHYKLARPNLDRCVQCGAPKLGHRVCDRCGSYAGRQVVEVSD
jgi:large subunit ribosomal protein L32